MASEFSSLRARDEEAWAVRGDQLHGMSRLTQTSSMEQVDLSDGGSAGDSSVEVPDVRARVSGFVHKVGALDEDIKTADTSKLQKYLHRFNLVVGVCLMVLTGFFGIAKSLFTLAISELVVSAYCLFFGFGMVLFEMTTSAKVAKFFRTNYGFLMTFNGRCCFLLFVGFFSLGTSVIVSPLEGVPPVTSATIQIALIANVPCSAIK